MALFVFCVNLLCAAFALVFAVEISALLAAGVAWIVEVWDER